MRASKSERARGATPLQEKLYEKADLFLLFLLRCPRLFLLLCIRVSLLAANVSRIFSFSRTHRPPAPICDASGTVRIIYLVPRRQFVAIERSNRTRSRCQALREPLGTLQCFSGLARRTDTPPQCYQRNRSVYRRVACTARSSIESRAN